MFLIFSPDPEVKSPTSFRLHIDLEILLHPTSFAIKVLCCLKEGVEYIPKIQDFFHFFSLFLKSSKSGKQSKNGIYLRFFCIL